MMYVLVYQENEICENYLPFTDLNSAIADAIIKKAYGDKIIGIFEKLNIDLTKHIH